MFLEVIDVLKALNVSFFFFPAIQLNNTRAELYESLYFCSISRYEIRTKDRKTVMDKK